jgi:hypothetical protein
MHLEAKSPSEGVRAHPTVARSPSPLDATGADLDAHIAPQHAMNKGKRGRSPSLNDNAFDAHNPTHGLGFLAMNMRWDRGKQV